LIAPIDDAPLPARIDLNQGASRFRPSDRFQRGSRGNNHMQTIEWIIKTAPEIFLLLAIAIGTVIGRKKFFGFSVGTTACILIVAVLLGQLGTFAIPGLLKTILFSLFVFTIGYKSGPEFFASLSLRTLAQVVMALVMGACGLLAILASAYTLHLDA